MTFLGDALSSQQPFGALALAKGFTFILVCQPDAHPTLYERWAFWQANDGMAACARRHWHGRCTDVTMERSRTDVLLLDGQDAWAVNGFEMTVVNTTTGEPLSHHSCIPNHRVTAEHVAAAAPAGRGQWKIDNENTKAAPTGRYAPRCAGWCEALAWLGAYTRASSGSPSQRGRAGPGARRMGRHSAARVVLDTPRRTRYGKTLR